MRQAHATDLRCMAAVYGCALQGSCLWSLKQIYNVHVCEHTDMHTAQKKTTCRLLLPFPFAHKAVDACLMYHTAVCTGVFDMQTPKEAER